MMPGQGMPNLLQHSKVLFASCEADVVALHPGPPAGWSPPADAPRSPHQRLAEAEKELLDLAIDRFVDSGGRVGDLARSVIVQRAVLGKA